MKKSINLWIQPAGMSLDKCLDIIKDAEFNAVEPNISEEDYLSLKSSEKDIESLRKKIEGKGLEIASVSSGLLWQYPLSSPDKEIRNKGEKVIEKALKSAKILGTDAILVVPGIVNEDTDYDDCYRRSQESLKKVAETAEETGVYIGIENVWNKFLLSPLEMKRFVEEIGSKYIGVYFDVGNVLVNGYPEMWIKILGKMIKRIHLKDFKTSVGNITGFCELLEGDVNWPKVIEALNKIGYNEYLTAELGPYKFYSETIIYNTSLSMDKILNKK
jgi:hexulose-6-phosphate isomerase